MSKLMIKDKEGMKQINTKTKTVIYTRRPSLRDILDIINKGRNVRTIKLSPSYMKHLGKTTIEMAKSMNVEIIENDIDMRGTRTDLNGNEITETKNEDE